ncbi:MAG TPA: metal-dependent hydrolase [Dehalococcoidia bacterium]|nr:metal-dependent hydrolase [Dehalococcoidia bacterium]
MLVLGHAGITLGAVTLLNGLITGAISRRENAYAEIEPPNDSPEKSATSEMTAWFTRLGHQLDIRLLLVGSLLPDIIDKPLGQVFLRETLSNGRIFFHTLLFTIIMALGGLFLRYRTGKTWLLALSMGTFAHLILDEMWQQELLPTLLWPLYGLEFPRADLTDWVGNIWYNLLHDPVVYVPEIIGGVVIILFLWVLVRNGEFTNFIRRGRLSDV